MQQSGEQPNVQSTYGWTYKKIEEPATELLDVCSCRAIGRGLEELVESGWLERRRNPRHQSKKGGSIALIYVLSTKGFRSSDTPWRMLCPRRIGQ